MNLAEFIVIIWLMPVFFQIIIPLVMFGGWMLAKLPLALLGAKRSIPSTAEAQTELVR